MRIRTDDEVIVISGKDKGKTGKVIRTDPKKDRVFVEGLNMVKRHQRPNPGRPNAQVGVIEKEGPIHVSNVAIVDPKDKKPTRIGIRRDDERPPHARHEALGARSWTDMARLKDRYNEEIRAALVRKFGYSSVDAGSEAGEGDAQHGRRRGQAGLEDARGRAGAARRRSPARSRTSAAPASPSPRSSCARACRSACR